MSTHVEGQVCGIVKWVEGGRVSSTLLASPRPRPRGPELVTGQGPHVARGPDITQGMQAEAVDLEGG